MAWQMLLDMMYTCADCVVERPQYCTYVNVHAAVDMEATFWGFNAAGVLQSANNSANLCKVCAIH